jgi:methionyl-tRNA formyltransferase
MPASSTDNGQKRVGVFGAKHTTRDLIAGLHRLRHRVDHCVTISPEKAKDQHVAGYLDLRPYLSEQRIACTVANRYSLKSDADREMLTALGLDVVLVMGWQRLLPDWLLASLSVGAFGMHGSSKPLPHGRGRSPMNWSIIQGKTKFYTHLFQYLPGVDDGPIVGVQTFDIYPWDDCHSLHLKNLVAMTHLCARSLPAMLDGSLTTTPQPPGEPTYYPKRSAEDGLIYWEDATDDIYNLIRAVTHPFPGAFTYIAGDPQRKLTIWRGQPFDSRLTWPGARPGEVLEVFYDGSFVVATGDGSLLVTQCDGEPSPPVQVGDRLDGLGEPRKQWLDLPR